MRNGKMGYNNMPLEKILEYCRTCGDLQLVRQIIQLASDNETTTLDIYCHSLKDAARKQRNIYKVLWYYPLLKPYIQTKLDGMALKISIGHKTEKRGRKPK